MVSNHSEERGKLRGVICFFHGDDRLSAMESEFVEG